MTLNTRHAPLPQKPIVYILLLFATARLAAVEQDITNMPLKKCPDTPNCVSSQSTESSQLIKPIAFTGSAEAALTRIKQTLLSFPRTRLVTEREHYLQVEFRSQLLKFVDDVEVIVDPAEKVLHIRSASRTGYWDFGANRKRVEQIRGRFIR